MGAFIEIGNRNSTYNVADSNASINLAQFDIVNVTNGNGIFESSAFNSNSFGIDGEIHVTNGSAMRISGMDNKVTVDFDGILTGNIGIWLDNGNTSPGLNGNSVVVEGQIVATGDGIRNEDHGTSILNLDHVEGATGIAGTTFGVTITNDDLGTIKGSTAGIDLSAINDPTQTSKITNHGTITGANAIIGGGEQETVVNDGTINGNVILGGGSDVFDDRKGTVNGFIEGGSGNDTYIVDNAATKIAEFIAGGTGDTVESTVSYTLGNNLENLILLGSATRNGTGNGEANNIHGNDGVNKLKGLDGDDFITGGKGDDILTGGTGADTFIFQTGFNHDTITDFHATGTGHDVIDLSDVASITSFSDLIDNHVHTSHGNAVIDAGHGDTITLTGVSVNSLTSGDFTF